jgi:hypothetical protein
VLVRIPRNTRSLKSYARTKTRKQRQRYLFGYLKAIGRPELIHRNHFNYFSDDLVVRTRHIVIFILLILVVVLVVVRRDDDRIFCIRRRHTTKVLGRVIVVPRAFVKIAEVRGGRTTSKAERIALENKVGSFGRTIGAAAGRLRAAFVLLRTVGTVITKTTR